MSLSHCGKAHTLQPKQMRYVHACNYYCAGIVCDVLPKFLLDHSLNSSCLHSLPSVVLHQAVCPSGTAQHWLHWLGSVHAPGSCIIPLYGAETWCVHTIISPFCFTLSVHLCSCVPLFLKQLRFPERVAPLLHHLLCTTTPCKLSQT